MSVGPNPKSTLLQRYLLELATNPLRTKAVTTGTLCFLQEILGSNIARVPPKKLPPSSPSLLQILSRYHVDVKALKMALYGILVSAPLSHYLVGALQKAFAGKTGPAARVSQIVASNLLIAPIQTVAYLSSMAIINGAKSYDEIVKTVKAGFLSVIRITWITSPVSITVAQAFIPVELWVPFFNAIQFVLGTYFNIKVKKMRLAAAKRAEEDAKQEKKD